MAVVKEHLTERILISIGIAIFGALTYVFNRLEYSYRNMLPFSTIETASRFLNALFSGLVFGLAILFYGEVMSLQISNYNLWLAVALGSISGGAGLNRLTANLIKLFSLSFLKR